MTVLYDPARHEPLAGTEWDAEAAQAALQRIVRAAHDDFDGQLGWPTHPLDDPERPGERRGMLYFGAGGIIWALEHLAGAGAAPRQRSYAAWLPDMVERNHAEMADEPGKPDATASLLMGDAGLLLLQYRLVGGAEVAERLYATVEGNLHHPSREALWGSPGTLLAALQMAEITGEPRWRELFARGVEILWQQMEPDPTGKVSVWRQTLGSRTLSYLGAGHGFAGNVYPALRGEALLPAARVAAFVERALATLERFALWSPATADAAERVNWPPTANPELNAQRLPLLQDCHGAPGIVCRFASAPRTAAWDRLLTAAAEMTWQAGPLAKGAGLCHGTAGNGYALLKQWQRSGEPVWLARARAFAMHAIAQSERLRLTHGAGRHSLWTGDEGVAVYLHGCLQGDVTFPTLDVF